MGKLSFRFGPGRSGGGGRRQRGGCSSLSGAGRAAIFVVNPDRDRVGEEERPRARAGGRTGGWASGEPIAGSRPGSQRCALPQPGVRTDGGTARVAPRRYVGKVPAGRAGRVAVFFLSSQSHDTVFSCCVSAVTTGGGTRSLTRYQPRTGPRDRKGPEGEGRDCYSSAGFRSRCRPFGATNPK
jgi:hypothetical protein